MWCKIVLGKIKWKPLSRIPQRNLEHKNSDKSKDAGEY